MTAPDRSILDSPLFILKKRLLLLTFFTRYFFVGAEYSVILPSVLLYMESLSASKAFMGICVAAYPIAAIISLPAFGYLYDRTKRTRELLLILNGFQIIGNLVYALPYSKWLPVGGRFLAGLGDGFIALVMGEITYIYDSSSRVGILALLELGRVLGMTVGPCLNFFLKKKRYIVGVWILDSYTLPGVIMAICWFLMQGVTMLCAFNLTKDFLVNTPQGEYLPLIERKDEEYIENITSSDIDRENELEGDFVAEEKLDNDESEEDVAEELKVEAKESEEAKSYCGLLSEMLSFEFFVIFYVDLILWFSQTIFEILLPYVTEFKYKWTPQATGSVYMIGGILLLLIFVCMYLLGDRLGNKETYMLLLSLVLTQVALALLMYETVQKVYLARVGIFCTICVLIFATIPFNLVCVKSLLTKIMRPELQGMVQGVSSAIARLAMIGGPLVSGFVFDHRRIYGAVASVLCYLALIGLFCSLGRITRRQQQITQSLSK